MLCKLSLEQLAGILLDLDLKTLFTSQPGSMSSLLKGKWYNQSWLIHGSMAEAICRLFQKVFVDSLQD